MRPVGSDRSRIYPGPPSLAGKGLEVAKDHGAGLHNEHVTFSDVIISPPDPPALDFAPGGEDEIALGRASMLQDFAEPGIIFQ